MAQRLSRWTIMQQTMGSFRAGTHWWHAEGHLAEICPLCEKSSTYKWVCLIHREYNAQR